MYGSLASAWTSLVGVVACRYAVDTHVKGTDSSRLSRGVHPPWPLVQERSPAPRRLRATWVMSSVRCGVVGVIYVVTCGRKLSDARSLAACDGRQTRNRVRSIPASAVVSLAAWPSTNLHKAWLLVREAGQPPPPPASKQTSSSQGLSASKVGRFVDRAPISP